MISDENQEIGKAYDAARVEGEEYFEFGLPRRVSYLINPEGNIAAAYDLAGKDVAEHAAEILADIA